MRQLTNKSIDEILVILGGLELCKGTQFHMEVLLLFRLILIETLPLQRCEVLTREQRLGTDLSRFEKTTIKQ